MDDEELQFLEEEEFVSSSGTNDNDANGILCFNGKEAGMSRSYEGEDGRKRSRPIYVEGGRVVTATGNQSQSLNTWKGLGPGMRENANANRIRKTTEVENENDNKYLPDDKAAAKFESLSKAVLIEVAVSQEAMMKRLQQSLRKEKEKHQATKNKLVELKKSLESLENNFRNSHVRNIDLLASLDTTLQGLDEKVSRAERQVSRVQASIADSIKAGDKLIEEVATEATSTQDVGIQCERPRMSLEWVELGSKDALRVNSDAPTSLDSPIIEHLIQCWASATNRCSADDVETYMNGDTNTKSAKLSSGPGSDVNLEYSCARIPLMESKQLLKQWINDVTTLYKKNLEIEQDKSTVNECGGEGVNQGQELEIGDGRSKTSGTYVAELNNLPKEIYDGFCIHLIPFLQGCGVQVKTYHRPRDVYDLKITAIPLKSTLPPKFVPDPGCIMCRDIYFYSRNNNDTKLMDEWHSFNSIHTYRYCAHCTKILEHSVTRRASIYNRYLQGLPLSDVPVDLEEKALTNVGNESNSDNKKPTKVDSNLDSSGNKKKKKKKKSSRNRVVRIDN